MVDFRRKYGQAVRRRGILKDWADPRRYGPPEPEPNRPRRADNLWAIRRVYDQGSEGSCGGFGSISAKAAITYAVTGNWIDLSARYSYDAAKVRDDEHGDYLRQEGTTLAALSEVAYKFGFIPNEVLPYVPQERVEGDIPTWLDYLDLGRTDRIGEYRNLKDDSLSAEEQLRVLRQAIWQGIAVPVGLWITGGWFHVGPDGRVRERGSDIGGHAFVLAYYDDDAGEFGGVNSWGKGWGAKGFGFLKYESVAKRLISGYMWTLPLKGN